MEKNQLTTLQLYNPEHVLEKKMATKKDIQEKQDANRQMATDQAAVRAMEELVNIVDVQERKELEAHNKRVEDYKKEQEMQRKKKEADILEVRETLHRQVKEKKQNAEDIKKINKAHDQIILNCPKEVVSIYPPIREASEEEKKAKFKHQMDELKEGLEKQMKDNTYHNKDLVLKEKKFMYNENQKKVLEMKKNEQQEKEKKSKVLNDYKKSWHREALTRQIQAEIQEEIKTALVNGEDMDKFEFDQEKFKKLDECKLTEEEETEVNPDDAISLAYDLSEYGDNMINRLVEEGSKNQRTIPAAQLKEKLEAIIEENNEGEGEGDAEDKNSEYKPITKAQLAAYEKLLEKLGKDVTKNGQESSQEDDTSTVLHTVATTALSNGQTYYSMRKIKDYLRKKAKEAKKIEIDHEDKEAYEMMKKLEKKPKQKITNLFNPMSVLKDKLDEETSENKEAKEKFMKRVEELTRKENDPYKRIKEAAKAKRKNPEKVHMQAVEKYLKDLESRAIEDKNLAVQQRPLNEELIQKQLSTKGLSAKFQDVQCDLCIMGISHSLFECMNHQQMIKAMSTKNAAFEVKSIIQGQIREKRQRELQEKLNKRQPGIEGNEGYPRCKELNKSDRKQLKVMKGDELRQGLNIQAEHKILALRTQRDNDKNEESKAIRENLQKILNNKKQEDMKSKTQRMILQKEWDRNEKVGDLKKAILNRKITPYNIESHLKGMVGNMSAKEYKTLVGGNKVDTVKKFFVESNKPIEALPEKSDLKLSYNIAKKDDHEIIAYETSRLHRRSMTDLKFNKFNEVLNVGKSMLPDIHSNRGGRQSMSKIHKIDYTRLNPINKKRLDRKPTDDIKLV
ncbi:unnamed protein product [Moneuplotes crassus]|uniref:Uncharacterized protein n=1 Tax=Euplotes crassus TaxID=5936 RepID=A0AAD1Y370_EUPCR|nr:unnamed protein product [Moneuplotes crassus]